MSLTYGQILKQASIRLGEAGSVLGSDMTTVEANYNNASFGASQVDNVRFPFSVQKDALCLAEQKIVSVIASVPNHPYRSFITSFSANLASRATLPNADPSGNKKIGVIGNIYDATNDILLTEKPIEEVERILRLKTNAVLKRDQYFYHIQGAKIVHTRTNVKIEMCVYNQTTQKTNIGSNLTCLLPDFFEEMYICGELSYLFAEDEAPDTIQQYVKYFADALARLEKGEK